MSAEQTSLTEFVEAVATQIARRPRIHPAGTATICEYLRGASDAARDGNAAEVARLLRLAQDKHRLERLLMIEFLLEADDDWRQRRPRLAEWFDRQIEAVS